MKKQVGNVVKMMKVVVNDIILTEMVIITGEDVQAIVTKASGVVSGLVWKRGINKMMNTVTKDEKVMSVCPVKDVRSGREMLMMVTSEKVVISDKIRMMFISYNDIESYVAQKGIVSNHMELESGTHMVAFEWGNKKLGQFTHDILLKKIRGSQFVDTWKSLSTIY